MFLLDFDEKKAAETMITKKTLKGIASAAIQNQYENQLTRVKNSGQQIDKISNTVDAVIENLPKASSGSLVVYGDPQSGKTEMMICLTAKLIDLGHKIIVHLMNDSVDLKMQSLDRFRLAGLAPAPRSAGDLANSPLGSGHKAILFCKKNSKDLTKLIGELKNTGPVIVIDDEADYATPNSKVNKNSTTPINELVADLIGENGKYIGVTATPARLNLNNTFDNRTETWVRFYPHEAYTGQEAFFPLKKKNNLPYRLTLLTGPGSPEEAQNALARFLVSVAYLNTTTIKKGDSEENYTFLVHTSGKTADHKTDREIIESAMKALVERSGADFDSFIQLIYEQAEELYPKSDAGELTKYVVKNASRCAFVVLNSKRDKASAGDKPTVPTCPFTVIIGGNIVSRGVTFPNLLSMYFTRDVKTKLQQDTYIQRARMFGARGSYLKHFELTIPEQLYADWSRCFLFHRLSLEAISKNKKSPVWMGDKRISIASASSIDRGTVDLNKGEMSFQIFDCPNPEIFDEIVLTNQSSISTLSKLSQEIGEALPDFLIAYLKDALKASPGSLAIHTSSSVEGYASSADIDQISRTKGFIGNPQLEKKKFPDSIHHVKIFHNGKGKARVFYKNTGGISFIQNLL
tara:strand:- start:102080 stop:103975 length:1896 start_codon:yes stop_codon:yes gene_type:complete